MNIILRLGAQSSYVVKYFEGFNAGKTTMGSLESFVIGPGRLERVTCLFVCLFLTEEAISHGGLRTRELGQDPSHVSMGD